MRKIVCCPVCRAICCIFNDKDTCGKYEPSNVPGYGCPDFLKEKDPEDDIPIFFVDLPGIMPHKTARG